MESTINIKWFDDIPSQDKEEVFKHGIERACKMLLEDYICGELIFEMDNKSYHGWWEKVK